MNINESLMIEVTRFCNMTCEHCLRGDIQRKRIKKETITKALEMVVEKSDERFIRTISFTGGEPALALDLIQFALDECKRLNIDVENFWMATNGTIQNKKFFTLIEDWIDYCTDNEISGLRISTDDYHGRIDRDELEEFKYRLEDMGYKFKVEFRGATNDNSKLLAVGRALENGFGWDNEQKVSHDIHLYDDHVEGEVYINVYGDVITTCDISYELQDEEDSEFNIGNIYKNSLDEIYTRWFENHPEMVD